MLFAAAAVILVPWTVTLARALPSRHQAAHWNLAWVGFDAMLTVALALLALALLRRSPWLQQVAVAAAALLTCDAWFDLTTATPGRELVVASLEAAFVELPVAALCLLIALRAARQRRRQPVQTRTRAGSAASRVNEAA
jgi:hypothetical protein